MAPIMCGCNEQKYSYVPGVVNVKENLSPVSSAFDLNSLSLEATVCGASSSLIQVTVVPAFTVMRWGMKANWSICTSSPMFGFIPGSLRSVLVDDAAMIQVARAFIL